MNGKQIKVVRARDGPDRAWKLPNQWRSLKSVTIYPLTPSGRGTVLPLHEGSVRPKLLAHVPYVAEKGSVCK